MVSDLISVEEKRQALERVLASRAFSRSDQLRSFLRFVCEADFDGRAQELNEYALGVSVLGRAADYSPAEDSCVRTRAYELRNKLKSYYSLESPDDPLQIEIRKGAYAPQFLRTAAAPNGRIAEPPAVSHPHPEPVPDGPANGHTPVAIVPLIAPEISPLTPAPVTKPERRRAGIWVWLLTAALGAAVATSAFLVRDALRGKSASVSAWTPEMRALWKPFLNDATPLQIAFEIRMFFFAPSTGLVVRDYRTNELADLEKSDPLGRFRKEMKASELQPDSDYADFGAVHAAFLLGRLLGPEHREIGLKHSGSLGWEDLWNSNVIFIGKPNLNPAIRYNLKGADFVDDDIGYVRNVHPRPGEQAEYHSAATHGSGVKYAVISFLPGPQSGHHVMVLGGAGAEFQWALAQYVADPVHAKELVSHLRTPSGEMPNAFQVLIEATFESNVPIKIRYVTHRVESAT